MTIVCATHFTETSLAAVRAAGELARAHREPLWLVHVRPTGPGRSDRAHDEAATGALKIEAAALSGGDLEVHSAMLCGALEPSIDQFCAEKRAGLLVLGDTGHQVRPLMAGLLDQLVSGADVPVLVVRDPMPFETWARGEQPLKVLLALDHSWNPAVACDWLTRLAAYGPLEVLATHVWWPRVELKRRGLPESASHGAISMQLLAETTASLSGLPANVKLRVHLELGLENLGTQLLRMAESEQVDVVVLGTQPRRGPLIGSSVSHRMFAFARTPAN